MRKLILSLALAGLVMSVPAIGAELFPPGKAPKDPPAAAAPAVTPQAVTPPEPQPVPPVVQPRRRPDFEYYRRSTQKGTEVDVQWNKPAWARRLDQRRQQRIERIEGGIDRFRRRSRDQ